MWEIYLLQRLDAICGISIAITIISGFFTCLFGLIITLNNGYFNEDEIGKFRYITKCSLPVFIISFLMAVFVPTKKEAYAIFGIGGTIDYIKNNETIKKFPDKAVIAIDKWLDDNVLDSENNKENNNGN